MSSSAVKSWQYEAIGPEGPVTGSERAANEVELDQVLARRGFTLVKAKSVGRDRTSESGRLGTDDLVTFTTQLATVLNAGVPIVDGMRDLATRMRNPKSRQVIGDVVRELEGGASLSQAMGSRPRSFPPIYRASVHAGELSGAMPQVLRRLAEHMEWTRGIRQTTTQALVYPAILGVAILGLITVLVTFLIPRVVGMFPGGADSLPSQTQQILALSNFVRGNWIAILIAIGGSIGGFMALMRSGAGRLWISDVILAIPRVGTVVQLFSTAKFASTAGILQNAGCSVTDVLEQSALAAGNARMQKSFQAASDHVQRGGTISESLTEQPHMDPLLLQMVAVGERSGDLGGCLDQLATHYDRELPRIVKWMLSLMEPALIFMGGGVVAYSLFAAFLPLLDMYDQL